MKTVRNNKKRVVLIILLVFLLAAAVSAEELNESGFNLIVGIGSGARRESATENGFTFERNVVTSTQPQRINQTGFSIVLYESLIYPNINDTNSIFDESPLLNDASEIRISFMDIVFNNSWGKINFTEKINLGTRNVFNFDRYVNVSSARAEINTTKYPEFERPAVISMQNLAYTSVVVNRDGAQCPSSICVGINYNSGTGSLTFNVTRFSIYQALEGNQSKLTNNGTTNVSISLLMIVQYYNSTIIDWVNDTIVINQTRFYNITPGSLQKLDDVWNPVGWNTSNATHGYGTYRIWAAATDKNGTVLMNADGTSINATFNFTYQNRVPTHGTPILNSSSGYNRSNENLTCWNQSTTDPDADAVKNMYNWYKNNTPIIVLNMPFEGGSTTGTETANGATKDYSTDSHSGTVVNATWSANGGYDGKGAYQFTGKNSSQYINFTQINLGTNYTLSVWVKLDDISTGDYIIVGKSDSNMNYVLGLNVSGNKIYSANNDAYAPVNYSGWNTNWHHYAVSREDTTVRFYIDGGFHNTTSLSTNTVTTIDNIGAIFNNGRDNIVNGTIDEVMLFNHTLSAAQIRALYENKTHLIDANETGRYNNFTCEVTPNDGANDGITKNSTALVVLNSPPTQPTVALNTSVNELENVTCNVTTASAGQDGDSVQYYYTWINGSGYNFTNGPTAAITDILSATNTSEWDRWNCTTTPTDSSLNGTNGSAIITIQSSNSIPNIIAINITPSVAYSVDTLNCTANATDVESASLNVTFTWFEDNVRNTTWDLSKNCTNSTICYTDTLVPSSQVTKWDNWTCMVNASDGANQTLRNASINISNTIPSIPSLVAPLNNNLTVTNRTPMFMWNASADIDVNDGKDTLLYDLNVTRISCAGAPLSCTEAGFFAAGISATNFTNASRSLDTDAVYNWSVRAYDGTNYGNWSANSNFTIVSTSIILVTNQVAFGSVSIGQAYDTTGDSPTPFKVENDGNVDVNITVYAQNSLWGRVGLNTSYFQFKARNDSVEIGSFDSGNSVTTWTTMNDSAAQVIADLNYTDTNDTALVDLKITVPTDEPYGSKYSTVVFTASYTP